jgi:16S rRNA (guanine527-N7)-methyltransferase
MRPEDAAALREWSAENDLPLDPDALTRLTAFLELLETWNRRTHLTGDRDPSRLVRRHLADSMVPSLVLPESGLVVDIGSGGGFPGIVLGCLRPDLDLTLIESRRRRASFLREAIRHVHLPCVRTFEGRAEDLAEDPAVARRAKVVIARALRLDAFMPLALPLVAPDGIVVAMQTPRAVAGASATAAALGFELSEVRRYRLPDGDSRALLLFVARRARGVSAS